MAVDSKRKQKQLTRKKAKRKAAVDAKKKAAAQLFGPHTPVFEALMPKALFEYGLGPVIFSREMDPRHIAVSQFLLDVYCLGVKDAGFAIQPRDAYTAQIRRMEGRQRFERVDPECLRKLVEEGVAYARDLGFAPHRDFRKAARIFHTVDPAVCATTWTFGRAGRPMFVAGPRDTPARCQAVLNTLRKSVGEGRFDFLLPGDDAGGPPAGIDA